MNTLISTAHLDVSQGISEARTKMYKWYIDGVLQLITQRYAKSLGKVAGFAGKQDKAMRGAR